VAKKRSPKSSSSKRTGETIWDGDSWIIKRGKLQRGKGRPKNGRSLFRFVAEKLPFDSLESVQRSTEENGERAEGVYLAHDSMGTARYGGRGQIFNRLRSHKKNFPRELAYFSFYIIEEKQHEREIETIILRAAGHQLLLNQRKVRANIDPGRISDFEPGTDFFERQKKRGRRQGAKRRSQPA